MLKIPQARFNSTLTMNFQMFMLVLEKAEESDQTVNICWIFKQARENIYFCFINYVKAFDCVDHNKLENSEEMRIPPPDLPPEKTVCKSRRIS